MDEPIALTIEYRPADFSSAARWVVVRKPGLYVSAAAFAMGFAVVGLVLFLYSDHAMGAAVMIGGAVGGVLAIPTRVLVLAWHARRAFQSSQVFQHPVNWLLTSTELRIMGKGLEATLELAGYMRVNETAGAFLLWQSSSAYNCLPKRAIPDQATLDRIRNSLRRGLPGTANIKLQG